MTANMVYKEGDKYKGSCRLCYDMTCLYLESFPKKYGAGWAECQEWWVVVIETQAESQVATWGGGTYIPFFKG